MVETSPNELKTQWKKEKLLVTSNFSFPHSVFKRLVLQTRKNQGLFWERVKRVGNIVVKGKYEGYLHLYFSPQCFRKRSCLGLWDKELIHLFDTMYQSCRQIIMDPGALHGSDSSRTGSSGFRTRHFRAPA